MSIFRSNVGFHRTSFTNVGANFAKDMKDVIFGPLLPICSHWPRISSGQGRAVASGIDQMNLLDFYGEMMVQVFRFGAIDLIL